MPCCLSLPQNLPLSKIPKKLMRARGRLIKIQTNNPNVTLFMDHKDDIYC